MKRLNLALLVVENNDYQAEQTISAKQAAHECEADLQVIQTEHDAVVQSQQVLKLLYSPEGTRPNGIFFEPVGTPLGQPAKIAASSGVGWVEWRAHGFEENPVRASPLRAVEEFKDLLALHDRVVLRLYDLKVSLALVRCLFRRDGLFGLIIIILNDQKGEVESFHLRPPCNPVGCLESSLRSRASLHVGSGAHGEDRKKKERVTLAAYSRNWGKCLKFDRFCSCCGRQEKDVIAGTELSVELPCYRLAASCQNFRLQLYLSARTIRPPSARVKFRWTKWKVRSGPLMQSPLDGNSRRSPMTPETFTPSFRFVPQRQNTDTVSHLNPLSVLRRSVPRSATAGSPSPIGHP